MGSANVRLCSKLLSHSQSYDEESFEWKIAFAEPTLRAPPAFAHVALRFFTLAKARVSKACLAWTKAGDVVGMTYY